MNKPKVPVKAESRPMTVDGYANLVAGLGASRPKTLASTYIIPYDDDALEAAYRTSTWFGKIVDIPADDATKDWRSWKTGSKIIQELEKEERRLGVRHKVRQALIWARLYGGAILVLGGLPGRPDSPLRPDAIAKGQIQFLTVLAKPSVGTEGIVSDPMSPWYGHAEYYTIGQGIEQIRLHPSRIVRFCGRKVASNAASSESIWGDSIWMHMRDSVTAADGSAATVTALMEEAKIDVVNVPNLMTSMGQEDYERLMLERFRLAAILKSVSNTLILDKDDVWAQKQVQWSGIPSVVETLLIIMAGAADIPVTRLIGTSAKGLNATGEGDLKNYYDNVRAKQELIISPELGPLDEILIRSALGNRPDDVWYEWNPLYKMDEATRIERDKTEAETVKIYYETGLIPDDALAKSTANRMIESGRWPGLESAIAESQAELGEQPERLKTPEPTPSAVEGAENPEAESTDAAPRTLYVSRKVLNGKQILAWAREQGFKSTLEADDLHVTIAYSHKPLDWMKVPSTWEETIDIPEGGARLMEQFGEARVLLFSSNHLRWRHEEIQFAGATWDHPEYQPHITISYDPESPDLSTVVPYSGKIQLGPEIFAEIDENWAEKRGGKK